jgi:hypothetical protein
LRGWEVDSLVKLSIYSYNRRAGQITALSNNWEATLVVRQ